MKEIKKGNKVINNYKVKHSSNRSYPVLFGYVKNRGTNIPFDFFRVCGHIGKTALPK